MIMSIPGKPEIDVPDEEWSRRPLIPCRDLLPQGEKGSTYLILSGSSRASRIGNTRELPST
jgi:hypothetical protein